MKEEYRTTGIYGIVNKKNGMAYVGKTSVSFGDRWDSHRALLRAGKHFNHFLQEDWNIFGEDSFEFKVLELSRDDLMLNELEKKYVKEYKDKDLSYNILDGGDDVPFKGRHLTDEAKRKIGEKNRLHMLGKKMSEETRKKMSESHKAIILTEEQKLEMSKRNREINLGRTRSDETKALLRKINQENPPSAKYTPDDIRAIRQKRASGVKLKDLAEEYDTTENYISMIVHRKRWSHVE